MTVEDYKCMSIFLLIFGGTIVTILSLAIYHNYIGNKYGLWVRTEMIFRILWPCKCDARIRNKIQKD